MCIWPRARLTVYFPLHYTDRRASRSGFAFCGRAEGGACICSEHVLWPRGAWGTIYFCMDCVLGPGMPSECVWWSMGARRAINFCRGLLGACPFFGAWVVACGRAGHNLLLHGMFVWCRRVFKTCFVVPGRVARAINFCRGRLVAHARARSVRSGLWVRRVQSTSSRTPRMCRGLSA